LKIIGERLGKIPIKGGKRKNSKIRRKNKGMSENAFDPR